MCKRARDREVRELRSELNSELSGELSTRASERTRVAIMATVAMVARLTAKCRREIAAVCLRRAATGGARDGPIDGVRGVGVGATLAPRTPLAAERRNSALVIFVFANTKWQHGSFCDGYAHYLMNIVNLIIPGLLRCVLWIRAVLCSFVHSSGGGGGASRRWRFGALYIIKQIIIL